MSRKSLVLRSAVDLAQHAHNCRASKKHRISAGEHRLKLTVNRSHVHYCAECAIKILEGDIKKLQGLLNQFRNTDGAGSLP